MGIGGISRWEDAAEYLLLGASAVQVCTAVMWNGYGIVQEMNTGLLRYLEKKGFRSPDELQGAALPRLVSHQSLDRKDRIRPVLGLPEACNGCGRCVIACRDGGYDAIRLREKRLVFNPAACDGCGLCIKVCPAGALAAERYRV